MDPGKIEPADELMKLYFQAKGAGFGLRFDRVWNWFMADMEISGEHRGQG